MLAALRGRGYIELASVLGYRAARDIKTELCERTADRFVGERVLFVLAGNQILDLAFYCAGSHRTADGRIHTGSEEAAQRQKLASEQDIFVVDGAGHG